MVYRLFHSVPRLWRFHSVHHGIEEMDWLAAHRVHPLDQKMTAGASLVPCFALGFSHWAIIAYLALYHWHSLMLHANIGINFGPFRSLVALTRIPSLAPQRPSGGPRPEFFAGQVPRWDSVFGTAHLPQGQKPGALWYQ